MIFFRWQTSIRLQMEVSPIAKLLYLIVIITSPLRSLAGFDIGLNGDVGFAECDSSL